MADPVLIPGMAHFAGTGPQGETCGSCEHHRPADRRCAQFARMMAKRGPAVSEGASACRHWAKCTRELKPIYDFGGAK